MSHSSSNSATRASSSVELWITNALSAVSSNETGSSALVWSDTASFIGTFGCTRACSPAAHASCSTSWPVRHIVAGASELGAFVTTDGARTWTHASGMGRDTDRDNAFSTAISPASGGAVYVQGLNLTEGQANGTDTARHIYASTDGGRHFHVAVTQQGAVTLANGTLLVPSPTDPTVLYFVWGTSYAGIGTYLYRYDANSGLVGWTHNGHDDIDSIAFNRTTRPSCISAWRRSGSPDR